MRDFVGADVVGDHRRREDQPPAERKIAPGRTRTPEGAGVAHRDAADRNPEAGGLGARERFQHAFGFRPQPVGDAARQVFGLARDADFAGFHADHAGSARRRARVPNRVRLALQRDDGIRRERYARREAGEPSVEPVAPFLGEGEAFLQRRAPGQRQHRLVAGVIDAQHHAPGAGTAPHPQRNGEGRGLFAHAALGSATPTPWIAASSSARSAAVSAFKGARTRVHVSSPVIAAITAFRPGG